MQIITDRRALHRIPELGWELPETMAYLKNALSGLNCTVFEPVAGALCAWFDFGRDSAIAFRADADALPITERTGAEYASTHPGKMHACGHDGHLAIALEVARRLSEKKALPHNVLLIFQPGEETPGGAKRICDTGIFEKYNVKAVFGLHLWPGLEAGRMFTRENELMSHASEVTVDIYGKSSHLARAECGIDALAAGVELYRQVRATEGTLPKEIYRLLNFGQLHSGTARNAVSEHTHMEGSLRAFQDEVFDGLKARLYEIAADVEAKFGCTVTIHMSEGYPAVMNPPELCRKLAAYMDFGWLEEPTMTSEDFSWYQRFAPGVFFFLGLGDVPALHTDNFHFDETILLKGADFFEKLAENYQ
ncbi:MAG: amidohydrolase [Oscillospiraceae bacterium]|nr:amidohydrolase [Oscillospiraceae bacterium]